MPAFSPAFLQAATSGHWTCQPASLPLAFSIDTRTLRPGDCFVALRTPQRDGHDFLPAARAAGAVAALVTQPDRALPDFPQLVVPDPLAAFQAIARAQREAFPGPVIGITGSAGKTSTKDLLAHLLTSPGHHDVLATTGNLNNHLGVPLTLTRLDPDRHRFAVIEAGISAPGDMPPLGRMIAPDLALVTFVGPAHLEALGTLDNVAREKASLPAARRPLRPAFFPSSCLAFLPFQNLSAPAFALTPDRPDAPANTPRFSLSPRPEGLTLTLHLPSGFLPSAPPSLVFDLPALTEGMASNAALALLAALHLGLDPADLQARLASWRPARLRGQWLHHPPVRFYADCYNANPASFTDALAHFAASAPPDLPRLYFLGGMEELGPASPDHHHALGQAIAPLLRPEDIVYSIGGYAEAVRAGALAAGANPGRFHVAPDFAALAAALAPFHGCVFLKGSRRYHLESLLPSSLAAAS